MAVERCLAHREDQRTDNPHVMVTRQTKSGRRTAWTKTRARRDAGRAAWPLDWQRHYRILAALTDTEAGGTLPDIQPGVLFEGDDLGKRLAQQRRAHTWAQLSAVQQERLGRLGVAPDKPVPAQVKAHAAKGAGGLTAPFRRGIATLAWYLQHEGHERPVPKKHEEPVDIDGQEHVVKLGVFISNTKSRRDKLTQEQCEALAGLGVEWA
ncbi:helicase associated domain-containing protein [Streptomyces sp. NBC_00654]|uniref:helicase associated domain-containing protein n=1 Tax=Streptomyces sp. NBC_00654 TaxID=2975799 RepID=UPI00225AE134|nr:helicase associated domain-containing protein [Streptomyces sp. NBC_00654]MCX4966952.1 helicase associated domain-containing protein [Streptomyces sp. NBC_00654]